MRYRGVRKEGQITYNGKGSEITRMDGYQEHIVLSPPPGCDLSYYFESTRLVVNKHSGSRPLAPNCTQSLLPLYNRCLVGFHGTMFFQFVRACLPLFVGYEFLKDRGVDDFTFNALRILAETQYSKAATIGWIAFMKPDIRQPNNWLLQSVKSALPAQPSFQPDGNVQWIQPPPPPVPMQFF